jgi:regulator of sigma E protease
MNVIFIIFGLLALSVLIIAHELGHFVMAKINGVKVEEFSVGMGPKVFGIKGKETEYLIKAFPIGGYVKMLGDQESSDDSRSFSSKSPQRKLSIIAAGPIMNFVIAILFFTIIASAKGFVIPVISEVQKNSPAEAKGLLPGDKIIKVNNKKISTWDEFTTIVYTSNPDVNSAIANPINITFLRDSNEKTIDVTPIKNIEENRYMIGVGATAIEKPNLFQSIGYGVKQCGYIIKEVFSFLGNAFKGNVSKDDVGGPVTIIKISSQAAQAGFFYLLRFSAFISVQLAIFNIIPFPALDGGWIFILLYEIITRKKVDDKKVAIVNYIGFTFLMILMVLVILKDVFLPINLN